MYDCCMTNQTMGVQREGAFSEYITMPVERIYDGKGIPADVLAMIEPFCISYHGMKKAKIQPGEQVLVIGAGTIGVLAAVAAKRMGAEVTICDVAQAKLDYAKEQFGVDHVLLNSSPEAFSSEVARLTDGRGFDVVAEAVGLGSTFLNCIEAAAFGGRMVQIGVGKQTSEFDFTMIQKKELQIFGSRNALKEDFLQLIEWVDKGEVDLKPLLTKEYEYLDAEAAFRDLDENNGSILKIVFKF
jgi:2-desacetyl-2-hydroxyethyl bacteriochlorophyllide A dehydrogenase